MNEPLTVTYEVRCAKGCGKLLALLTLPDKTPPPADLQQTYECPTDCMNKDAERTTG